MNLEYEFYHAGEPCTNLHLYSKAWDEYIELQGMNKQDWLCHYTGILESVDRWEIGIFQGDKAVGGIVLALDSDIHVGHCMSVISQYVLPEFRNRHVSLRCMRTAIDIAHDEGCTILAYTHRLGDWRYKTIYRRI